MNRAGRRAALRRACGAIALCALAIGAVPARAEVWAYIDRDGRAHFATRQLDDRYQLFFKGGSSLDPPRPDATQAEARAALMRSPLYRRVVDHPNARRYAPLIERHASVNSLDAALLKAMIAVESGYDPAAVSDKGAIGLMQVMPATGERYGVAADMRQSVVQKLMDPATNVRIGARYLRDLLKLFAGDRTLALAAYNAGEQAVMKYGNQVPPYPETRDYVELVRQFEVLYRPPPAPRSPPARPALELPGKGAARPPA
ncbi:MAG: lytic transglycosylase domain-containing protein [Casimicrobiaceae bacterium]